MNEYVLNQLKQMFEMAICKELLIDSTTFTVDTPSPSIHAYGNNSSYLHAYLIKDELEIKFKIINQKKEINV